MIAITIKIKIILIKVIITNKINIKIINKVNKFK
jgi:hypothetical protein